MWKLLLLVFSSALALEAVPNGLLSEDTPENRAALEYVHRRLGEFKALKNEESGWQTENQSQPESKQSRNSTSHEITHINANVSDYLYEGDIMLTPQEADNLLSSRPKRQAIRDLGMHWPNNYIPYWFDPSIDSRVRGMIRQAMDYWEKQTCLQFREDYSRHFIRIFKGEGCWSMVGYATAAPNSRYQDFSIGEECGHIAIIAHEVGHALGFYHEQSRTDRNQYVSIQMNLVKQGQGHNFALQNAFSYNMPYDYGSLMHYAENDFAYDDKSIVMTALDGRHQQTMGERIAPSFYDVQMMNTHYRCHDLCAKHNTTCYYGGYRNSKNCNECICPWGFGGKNCERRHEGNNNMAVCGSNLFAAAELKNLSITMGQYRTQKAQHDHCHWHIWAPKGRRVEIHLTDLGYDCTSNGCFYSNLEFKIGKNFANSGFRMCCRNRGHYKTLTSETNLAVVSAYARMYDRYVISYRYV